MLRKRLIIVGGLSAILWGMTHLIPTRLIFKEFNNISVDKTQAIKIEWIVEGLTLILLGIMVILVAAGNGNSPVAKTVYLLSSVLLFTTVIVSPFTRFWIEFLLYKLCPIIFSASAIVIIQGMFQIESNQQV